MPEVNVFEVAGVIVPAVVVKSTVPVKEVTVLLYWSLAVIVRLADEPAVALGMLSMLKWSKTSGKNSISAVFRARGVGSGLLSVKERVIVSAVVSVMLTEPMPLLTLKAMPAFAVELPVEFKTRELSVLL